MGGHRHRRRDPRAQDARDRARARPLSDGARTLDGLCNVGMLEIAALTGFIVSAAASRDPGVIDGAIAAATAVTAEAFEPKVSDYPHRRAPLQRARGFGCDRAPRRVARARLRDRLGKGTSAVLAMPTIQAAFKILRDMATFDAAGVTDKGDPRG